jgi:hypothetical protein
VAALRSAVQAYKQEEELAGNIGIKPVKRRRDIAQVQRKAMVAISWASLCLRLRWLLVQGDKLNDMKFLQNLVAA